MATNRVSHLVASSVVFLFLIGLVLSAAVPTANGEFLGSWTATTSYPGTNVLGNSCAISGGYIYCVGGSTSTTGITNSTYYGDVSASGIGSWTPTTKYPTNLYLSSCAISASYIYCVGGLVAPGSLTNAVYYATVSSAGIGTWTSTTAYPATVEDTSCTISGSYITCVGGLVGVGPNVNTNEVYYASVSSGGVGAWKGTTNYPGNIDGTECISSGGYITCVGGQYDAAVSNYINDSVWYNSVSMGALGASWTATTNYPATIANPACTLASGNVYCVGGYHGTSSTGVYYGALTSGAISSWSSTTSYPTPVEVAQCETSGGYIYCVGGQTSSVYYTQITTGTATTTSVSCSPLTAKVGSPSTCTATVTGSSPTGTITWSSTGSGTFNSSKCTLSSGSCSVNFTPSSTAGSPFTITGSYGGDMNNQASAGVYTLTVAKAATVITVACSPSNATVGSPTTCTAAVAGQSPTGMITWTSSGTANFSPSASCTISSGSCSVSYTPSSPSSQVTITATYAGDQYNEGSSGAFTLAVHSGNPSGNGGAILGLLPLEFFGLVGGVAIVIGALVVITLRKRGH